VSERVALVTLAIGERYLGRWRRRCEPGWRAYAERHGYELRCLTEPLDTSERARSRSPAWQKCLVLEHQELRDFDRVVWVDADVAINPAAPPVVATVPIERVGAVDEYSSPTPELHALLLEKLYAIWDATGHPYVRNPTPADYYSAWDLDPRFEAVVQTGVMVLSPAHHAELLRRAYDRYEDRGAILNYEMRPLSWELLEAGVVEWIDPRFNEIWGSHAALHHPFLIADPAHESAPAAVRRALESVHFLHFAGSGDALDLVEPAVHTGSTSHRRDATAAPPPAPLRAPVAMAVFARPDLTARVLDAVRAARPSRLLVFANAPRPEVPGEAELCAATRALFDRVDWPCELETRFADFHMDLRESVGSGIGWVFERAEEAIILEDDCLPEPSFFPFCDELLERYRDDERVWAISGDDFRFREAPAAESYVFSRYPLIWGWATWRRAWRNFDDEVRAWPELRDSGWLDELLGDRYSAQYWTHQFESLRQGLDAWDYAWVLACWIGGGLTALPTRNLVSNLGFRADATHTREAAGPSPFAALPTEPLDFPLVHPPAVARDEATDAFIEDVMFGGNLRRTFERLRRIRAGAAA
jgi:hypothetical protein